jgi:hypothetical protein
MSVTERETRFLEIPDSLDFEEANEALYQRGMTDGLPVVPPTHDRVARMLDGVRRDPAESLGRPMARRRSRRSRSMP